MGPELVQRMPINGTRVGSEASRKCGIYFDIANDGRVIFKMFWSRRPSSGK